MFLKDMSIWFLDIVLLQEKPRDLKFCEREKIMFLLTDSIVLPHIAKSWLLKLKRAQKTKDKDMQTVFPDRIAPSHIIE